ncbi:dihydrolipoamide acetyltransferase family protein [Aureibacillus halotolerans]|uniref:Dihydrolipoamide acetyltransferase component of pyruvate dehydrogenase complex n=1 Tax=Aureibacillus halotolerans TaxID=1508390 RepID=A0A4R6U9W1_9BACI|nr:dihydrolipoamide acetyltransferase family protein [Aureibacillus halotolerans]TDQ41629.1 2-oxoisovalerate dehydrogenase E2 component (dihydrolipoyl transacylase) [Aureibacillus halotolerans]
MALETIKMPQLGESVTEGTVSKWLVKKGDNVKKYDPIAEVMTDKVSAEVPSTFQGVVEELIAEEGMTIAIGEPMCTMEVTSSSSAKAVSTKAAPEVSRTPDKPLRHKVFKGLDKNRFSPAVRWLAEKEGIELSDVEGTGKRGRVTRQDVEHYIAQKAEVTKNQPVEAVDVQKETKAKANKVVVERGDVVIPVQGVRAAIAKNMLRSTTEIPHAWTMVEVDVTGLVQLRDKIKNDFKSKEGYSITYFPFFVNAVVEALREYPQLNAVWGGDQIIQKNDIHISIAVATDDALFVPVIRHADEKSIKGLAREVTTLASKVRSGKIRGEEMTGGTFTVNNAGSFGSVQSMGIINYPQAALLQVQSIVKRPVVLDDGRIEARDIVNLCMSLDHRILDGLVCGRFLGRVKELLERIHPNETSIY